MVGKRKHRDEWVWSPESPVRRPQTQCKAVTMQTQETEVDTVGGGYDIDDEGLTPEWLELFDNAIDKGRQPISVMQPPSG